MTTLTDRPAPTSPAGARRPSRVAAALAGVLAAAAALSAGELPTALAGEPVGLVAGVGNEFIDRFAGSLKDLAVELFGTNDKRALVVGVVETSLAFGAVLGVVALRWFAVAAAGFVAFGAVGMWALATDPSSTPTMAAISAGLAVTTGVGALAVLVRRLRPRTIPLHLRADVGDPTVRTPDRRSFLVAAGAVGVSTVAVATGGRALRSRNGIQDQRAALALPEPLRATPVPAGGLVEVDGITPFITPNADFYRIDTALFTPQVDAGPWRLRVTGMVDRPFELAFDELLAMDLVEEPVTIACVSNELGGNLVGTARWLGVPLAAVLERAGVQPGATQVVGRSTDSFTAGFPLDDALDGRVAMVALGMNGEPLPASHGYPARLVVAGLYGYVSATKWLTEIELNRFEDFDGYWIPLGWSKEGPVKTQSRIDVPGDGAEVAAGTVAVAGVAWAPDVGITAVEVQVDDGSWRAADLGPTASRSTWVQWVLRWDASPGRHVLRVRATDATGTTQTPDRASPAPDGATGHHTVRVSVRA